MVYTTFFHLDINEKFIYDNKIYKKISDEVFVNEDCVAFHIEDENILVRIYYED